MNECRHPKGFISNIGNFKICNLCGKKFYKQIEPGVKEVKDLKDVPEAECKAPEVKPEAKIEPTVEPKPEKVEEPKQVENEAPKAQKPRKKKNNKR